MPASLQTIFPSDESHYFANERRLRLLTRATRGLSTLLLLCVGVTGVVFWLQEIPVSRLHLALFSAIVLLSLTLAAFSSWPFRIATRFIERAERLRTEFDTATLETFAALNALIEAKDRFAADHGKRVTLVSVLIAQELGIKGKKLDAIRRAAAFHDIGKLAISDAVVQRLGRMETAEYEEMKRHTIEGERICSTLSSLDAAAASIRSHHERFDGRGYPDGLSGSKIPLGARIIAVADSWDAITSDRPYRRSSPPFIALDEIRRCSGSQFDPHVVGAFVEVLAKDPWMFGLTPEDVRSSTGKLPSPETLSLGIPDPNTQRTHDVEEIDWSSGIDHDEFAA